MKYLVTFFEHFYTDKTKQEKENQLHDDDEDYTKNTTSAKDQIL